MANGIKATLEKKSEAKKSLLLLVRWRRSGLGYRLEGKCDVRWIPSLFVNDRPRTSDEECALCRRGSFIGVAIRIAFPMAV